ncbi:hypothetical protein L226DRAFT_517576 [Lentinus tigrinus ALCF2SS1-7]|uniref:SAP domain-containing protein n=1 Tax=Lentinus tigrinus ALCF2SS1-6 TaxID=1328759 RepID=A0A5C2RQP3_9APHY|nr:hypothetical protein L227DRAFT_581933 [Lentinus tigrinus ALCF2SS1-6]RPD68073.1 hypothetical protein L226DRAFT_517576 [Lentinus tigrinus ALCF2SS1-7]
MASYDRSIEQVHEAYRRLTHEQLVLFLKVRSLPTSGTDGELASRLAQFDIHTYHFPSKDHAGGYGDPIDTVEASKHRPRQVLAPDLPTEVLADIMDQVGDWELAKAVGVPTSLPQPPPWAHANPCDHAILSGYIPLIRASDPATHPPNRMSAKLAVRFSYVNVLEYFFTHHRSIFLSMYKHDLIPITASRHGRTAVLSWWKHTHDLHPDAIPLPDSTSVAEAIDGASRDGQVASLDWWLHSGIPLEYTEAALEGASAKNRIEVLEWWKDKASSPRWRLPLKIGRVMDMASTAGHVEVLEWWASSQLEPKYDRQALYHASCHGKVEVLQWWLGSGLQMIFDQEALTGASRHNRPEVLEWWDKSGLPIQYRMCDIEEALEDAIGGGEQAREWWRKKGVDFNANDKEWSKLQYLN